MQRRRFLTGSALLAGAGLVPPPAMARRLFPADVTDRYVAWQGERVVGRQEISFKREPGQFVVDVKIDMRFVAPGVGDVSYSHESREVWEAGWLQALESQTRVDGRIQSVHAERRGGSLMVDGSDVRSFQVSTYLVPSSLWHRDSRLVRRLPRRGERQRPFRPAEICRPADPATGRRSGGGSPIHDARSVESRNLVRRGLRAGALGPADGRWRLDQLPARDVLGAFPVYGGRAVRWE